MMVSMVNLVIFGEDDTRYRRTDYNNFHLTDKFGKTNLFPKNLTANSILVLQNGNPNSNNVNRTQQFLVPNHGNLTFLLANFTGVISSLQNINLIPNRDSTKNNVDANKRKSFTVNQSQLNTIEQDLQSLLRQQPYGFRLSEHRKHRKNFPTKPSEVILVVSGCLFFITFFLGTFAQIKSEVSFYTMVIRFIHYNQQWLIEEYNQDLTEVASSAAPHASSPTEVVDNEVSRNELYEPGQHMATVVNSATDALMGVSVNTAQVAVVGPGVSGQASQLAGTKQVIDL